MKDLRVIWWLILIVGAVQTLMAGQSAFATYYVGLCIVTVVMIAVNIIVKEIKNVRKDW